MTDIKVLHLIDSGGLYGAEKMLLTLVAEQIKLGIEPVILSAGELGTKEKALELEARKLDLPIVVWRLEPGLNFKQALTIARWARKERFHVLHSHGYKFNILLGILPRGLRQLPLVTTVHGYVHARRWSKMWVYELVDQFVLRRLDKVCLVSGHMRNLKGLARVSYSKTAIVENGLGPSRALHAPSGTLPTRFDASFKILVVGRLSPEKNIALLIRALANCRVANAAIEVFIVGEGHLRTHLERLAKGLECEHKVHFLGYRSDVPDLMKSADLLVIPSLTEGLPITLLEAMRSGLPIAASAVGGIPEALDHGRAGYLFNPNSEDELVNALDHFVTGKINRAKTAELAEQRFREIYTGELMAKKYLSVYSEVI